MATKIEWAQDVWNPFIGCDKVSPGCENCYAIRMAYRLAHMPATKPFYGQVVYKTKGGKLNWTGKIVENMPAGDKPLRTKKPTTFFVNSMSDLFHEKVTFEMIDSVYDVMDACPQHTFQVLTKRSKRMNEYYQWKDAGNGFKFPRWPLLNVWVGISAENQKMFDERIEHLLLVPAAIRFLSCEPLLGQINIGLERTFLQKYENGLFGFEPMNKLLHWIIVGGESGPNSRPMNIKWIRSLQEQCASGGVAFFFKQFGEWLSYEEDGKCLSKKVGKSKSGNLLDGKQYLEMPKEEMRETQGELDAAFYLGIMPTKEPNVQECDTTDAK